jgi:Domain of unknown function (DUF4430)
MVVSPPQTGDRLGNPVEIRDGPAAVRGDALRHDATGFGREGGGGGAPSQKTHRPAANSNPSRKGGFVHRLLFAFAALVAASAVLVPSALGVRVSVRVEGKTTTIYGAAEPRFEAGANAMDALETASALGEFFYEVKQTSFGPYVARIGRYPADSSTGWVFKVNGASPPVGADKVVLSQGDRVLWYWAEFGPTGGPKTLLLQRRPKGCYRVLAQDDSGKSTLAQAAVLQVDGRRVRTRNGTACPGVHRGLVRATLPGAVRSNAVS